MRREALLYPRTIFSMFEQYVKEIWAFLGGAAVSALIAGWCAMLSYAYKVEEGKPFKPLEFFLHFFISATCGWLIYDFLADQVSPSVIAALCGSAGWGGTRLIRICEIAFCRRMGIEPNEVEGTK